MSSITSITVAYGRKIQPAPYESADASVSLTLAFDQDETQDIDGEIAKALDRAVEHVGATLNIRKEKTSKPAVKANLDTPEDIPAKAAPAPAKKEAPKKAPAKAAPPADEEDPFAAPAAAAEEVPETTLTKGDLAKAITNAQHRMKGAGVADGSDQIKKLVFAYSGKDKPPVSYSDVPPNSWADFVSDLDKLGR